MPCDKTRRPTKKYKMKENKKHPYKRMKGGIKEDDKIKRVKRKKKSRK